MRLKSITLVSMLLLVFALSSCETDKKQNSSSDSDVQIELPFIDPTMVVEDFLDQIEAEYSVGIKQHCTNDFWELLRKKQLVRVINSEVQLYKEMYYWSQNRELSFQDIVRVTDQSIDGNEATVDFCVGNASDGNTFTLYLVIQDGEWVIEDISGLD